MAYTDHVRGSQQIVARCAVITLSDTRTAETDKSGRRIRELLEAERHHLARYEIIPDDMSRLQALLTDLLSLHDLDVVLTNGGTGISRRDTTIEVVETYLDQTLPGFGELFRMLSFHEIGSGAILSRAVGGIAREKLLFAMPGSTGAVELAMSKLILPELRHLVYEMRK
ncbi:MAG TPA: MogA/MoaB family molybdenum cofactor biosynthesis protein [Tepidisphaeraceae bacterium]|jgi:molybdenum cofactor biosynthesis protein B|nr:MogA/MoaB family molybdenum cofactor biosynthesis protein [Tepidisphaeraceae bacterium]